MAAAIDTTAEVISEETLGPGKAPVEPRDVPIYTVARAVEYLKRPENAVKVERAAKVAGEVQRDVARYIDDEVTKIGRLGIDLMTNDDILEEFTDSLLGSLIGD